jgi:diguanylate cyclase (GGDEF)-like protein
MSDARPGLKILILDDDPSLTALLAEILKQDGYEVIESNSAKDVLFLARQFRPDLLLLDIMMPEVDGYDVCDYFRGDPELKFTRIVVLTALDNLESRLKCYRAGADVYLAKPFEISELREIIRNHLQSKLALDQLVNNLSDQTITDRTIDCYNRRYLEKRITEELKRVNRATRNTALLLIDLDQFQTILLRYGFAFGNEILKEVAGAIRNQLREIDLLGRYSDGSFLVVLPDTSASGAKSAASRIPNVVASLPFLKKKRIPLRVTVARSLIQKGTTLQDALDSLEAEMAKARAKQIGKR